MSSTETSVHRLPTTVTPSHYALRLAPVIPEHSFTGDVTIHIEINEPTNEIVLNAIELDIDGAQLVLGPDTSPADTRPADSSAPALNPSIELDEANEQLRLGFDQPLDPGPARLSITFSGTLNDQLRGFYRSTYLDDEGAEHTIATTQFQSTDARRAFPCWDEPEAKATFGVTLDVPEALVAISNGPEVSAEPIGDGIVRRTFADTMVMSTYLVAFVVGELEITADDGPGVPLRVVHRPGRSASTPFALEVARFALDWLADWYGIEYPDAKVDLIAVPDFAMGAMENLGCVTFRETLLLVDPDAVTRPELQRVVDVICHELAHMWFGDLVTMSWWNGIWLNEAFATFMEVSSCDAFRPEWRRWQAFSAERTAAFEVDGLHSTRAIEFPVESPAEAEAMFDVLTYEKGAAVVRMLEQHLGPDTFRSGINRYLTTHAYDNTDTPDLWAALEAESGQPVGEMMDSWILRRGHPLVTLEVNSDRLGAEVSVERFSFLPDPPSDSDQVPITPVFLAEVDAEPRREWTLLVTPDGVSVEGPAGLSATSVGPGTAELIFNRPMGVLVANRSAHAFLRCAYDATSASLLVSHLDQLDASERYSLLDDTWALVRSGSADLDGLVALITTLFDRSQTGAETDPPVLRHLVGISSTLVTMSEDRSGTGAWLAQMLWGTLDRIGVDAEAGEESEITEVRGVVLTALGRLDDPKVAELAAERAEAHLGGAAMPAAHAAAAIDTMARNADQALFDRLMERYVTGDDPQDALRSLQSLGGLTDEALMDELLAATLDRVRGQDGPFLIRRSLANTERAGQVWTFIEQHWGELYDRFAISSLVRMLDGLSSVTDPEVGSRAVDFLAAHPIEGREQLVAQHLERLAISLSTTERLGAPLAELGT